MKDHAGGGEDRLRAGVRPGNGAGALRYETFRSLYFAERARRDEIRGSIGVPAAAISFLIYANMTLATRVRIDAVIGHWPSMLMVVAGLAAIGLLVAAVWRMIQVEWLFVYSEPPDLDEMVRIEQHVRARHASDDLDEAQLAARIEAEMREAMTAGYYIAYQRYFAGNTDSARHRTWALRLVLMGFLCLLFVGALLPFHLQVSGG